MPAHFDPVGVLFGTVARLVHRHRATSAGWVSIKGPVELLLSAGGLPSQCCVLSLQGIQLKQQNSFQIKLSCGAEHVTKAQLVGLAGL